MLVHELVLEHHTPACVRVMCACLCVSQNTYTNAEKLLEAADQLAQSGECEEEEIYQAARDLELRMQVRHKINPSAGGSSRLFYFF